MRLFILFIGIGILVGGCGDGSDSSPDMASCPSLQGCVDSSDCSNGEPCIELGPSSRGCLTPGYTCAGLQNCSAFSGTTCLGPKTLAQSYSNTGVTGACAVEIITCANGCVHGEATDGGGSTMAHCK
ncbi:MAG: hypothetical protein ACXVDD_10930 [Polyangia bacterium]